MLYGAISYTIQHIPQYNASNTNTGKRQTRHIVDVMIIITYYILYALCETTCIQSTSAFTYVLVFIFTCIENTYLDALVYLVNMVYSIYWMIRVYLQFRYFSWRFLFCSFSIPHKCICCVYGFFLNAMHFLRISFYNIYFKYFVCVCVCTQFLFLFIFIFDRYMHTFVVNSHSPHCLSLYCIKFHQVTMTSAYIFVWSDTGRVSGRFKRDNTYIAREGWCLMSN